MNVYCNGCGMCCKLIPVKDGDCILVRDGFQIIDDDFFSGLYELSEDNAKNINQSYVESILNLFTDVKFYGCKHLSSENKCTLEEMPSVCAKFPSTPVAIIPDECSCMGDIFIKNEQLRRKIRMIKEEILDYEILIENGDKNSASYRKIIDNLTRFVIKYRDFGSDNW